MRRTRAVVGGAVVVIVAGGEPTWRQVAAVPTEAEREAQDLAAARREHGFDAWR
jgi:hypothetical protein